MLFNFLLFANCNYDAPYCLSSVSVDRCEVLSSFEAKEDDFEAKEEDDLYDKVCLRDHPNHLVSLVSLVRSQYKIIWCLVASGLETQINWKWNWTSTGSHLSLSRKNMEFYFFWMLRFFYSELKIDPGLTAMLSSSNAEVWKRLRVKMSLGSHLLDNNSNIESMKMWTFGIC